MTYTQLFDISPLISEKTGVFPGDVAYQRQESYSTARGQHMTLSSIQTTLHLGAHADAPVHYGQGPGIAERDLRIYVGPCRVIRADVQRNIRIGAKHFTYHGPWNFERILVYTGSFPDPNHWNSDFCSFEPELLETWAKAGVKLVGIDTPSVDPEDSKKLEAHQVLEKYDMAVLEGLILKDVPEGDYFLIAPPLKLAKADASPVRALLLK